MRVGLAGVCLVGWLAVGCSSSSKAPPSLTLSPSGVVTVQGPKTFQATAINTGGPVTWTLTGTGNIGTLSATTGERIVYRPPATPAVGATATLTATSGSFTATAQLQLSPPALTAAQIPSLTDAVEVRYDQWEIPHITCAKAVDCFAVQGYLHARDRLFQIDLLRRAATGKMAELVGVLGLSQDIQLRTLFTTRAGERLGDALARNMAASRPATNAKTVAYVAGINAWLAHLRATGAPLPGEYAQLPYHVTAAATDIPDWTVSDVISLMRLMQYQLSSTLDEEVAYGQFAVEYGVLGGKASVWMRTQQPSSEQTFTLLPGNSPAPLPKLAGAGAPLANLAATATAAAPNLSGWGGPLASLASGLGNVRGLLNSVNGSTGSNDWVVDAGHSATGKAMVANDPHLSLQYPPNFYLATLTSTDPTEHLDVTGGGFAGTPGAQVGRGQHVGWGVTVVGYDVTDIYQEQFLPAAMCPGGFPYCVLFKGAPVNLIPVPLTFMVRTSSGVVNTNTLVLSPKETPPAAALIVPHHGPIIQAPDAAGKAFSVRWTGHEDATQDLSAFLDLDTALDVAGAMTAVNNWATGAQNFVLADDQGNIGYNPHALVPKRPWAGTMPGAQPLLPWIPLPGDGSAEWGSGNPAHNCAASGVASPNELCWIANADLPQATGSATGFLITANADPVGTSNNVIGPFGVPLDVNGNYLSFGWDDSTAFRHARITERMKQALTAGGGKVSQADMEAIQTDHTSRMGAAFYRYIASLPLDSGTPAFKAARAMLDGWRAVGFDCPSGLLGIDPVTSPPDTTPAVYAASSGCFLFHEFARELLTNVFADDLAQAGLSVGPVQAVKGMLYMLEPAAGADQSFCNNVDAAGATTPVTCEAQVRTALESAFSLLYAQHGNPTAGGWIWGRVHTFQPVSQFPLVTLGYEPGPFARPGGAFTVDVASPSLSKTGTSFAYGSSANVRHVSVMDPAAPVVRMQLPGPEVSRPYGVTAGPDLLADWARNTYFNYAHGNEILNTTVSTQRFTP
jgi:penicillin G amidase